MGLEPLDPVPVVAEACPNRWVRKVQASPRGILNECTMPSPVHLWLRTARAHSGPSISRHLTAKSDLSKACWRRYGWRYAWGDSAGMEVLVIAGNAPVRVAARPIGEPVARAIDGTGRPGYLQHRSRVQHSNDIENKNGRQNQTENRVFPQNTEANCGACRIQMQFSWLRPTHHRSVR